MTYSFMGCFEWLVLRAQSATGVPRWRMESTTLRVYGLLMILNGINTGLSIMGPAFLALGCLCGGFLIVMSILDIGGDKAKQELADRTQLVVPNITRGRAIGVTMRLMAWGWLVFCLWTWAVNKMSVVMAVCFFLGTYLGSCHTWPMQGPGLWKKLKGLFTLRKVAVSHAKG